MSKSPITISALSPSSINKWSEDPASWVASYAFGVKEKTSPKMMQGTVIEAVLYKLWSQKKGRSGPIIASGSKQLLKKELTLELRKNFGLTPLDSNLPALVERAWDMDGDELDEMIHTMDMMLNQAIVHINQMMIEPPNTYQYKLERNDHRLIVPIMGYLDFAWNKSGRNMVMDLKTTARKPSSPSISHMQQLAFYVTSYRSARGSLLYVTPKTSVEFSFSANQLAGYYESLVASASALLSTLNTADWSADRLASMFTPNIGHNYLWKGVDKQEYRDELSERIPQWKPALSLLSNGE